MNTLRSTLLLTFFSLSSFVFAQNTPSLLFSMKQLSDNTWGVFVKPNQDISPTTNTATGSGQVTLVAPIDFDYESLENYGGNWVENARVDGPEEATDKSYISFGFVADAPKLNIYPNEASLLFTFEVTEGFEGSFSLFENGVDPFAVPNSYHSNPGNDLGIIDYGVPGQLMFYTYEGNHSSSEQAQAIFASSNNED